MTCNGSTARTGRWKPAVESKGRERPCRGRLPTTDHAEQFLRAAYDPVGSGDEAVRAAVLLGTREVAIVIGPRRCRRVCRPPIKLIVTGWHQAGHGKSLTGSSSTGGT